MKWLAPIIILVILLIFGAWFCSKHEEPAQPKKPPVANTNANANANANSANTANANTAVLVNANTVSNGNSNTNTGNINK